MKPMVLVIEDSNVNMDLMVFVLGALGLTVVPALSGAAGLAIAKSACPDLIFCDMKTPYLDGLAVLAAFKADPATACIPIIALTVLALIGDGERLLTSGFDGYLSKPIAIGKLKAELRKHLPVWGSLQH